MSEEESCALGCPLKTLEISQGTREELESLGSSRSLPAGRVRRIPIVLLCADGPNNKTVAERVRTTAAKRSVSGASISEPRVSWACTMHPGRKGTTPSEMTNHGAAEEDPRVQAS